MKKIISIFAALTLLVSMLAFSVAAEGADMQFSVTDAEAKPGDTVKVDVMVDKNAGVYGMKFWITYDNRCFDLVSVTNGEVFKDSEAELLTELDDSGEYIYYAESSELSNNTKTGVLVTLEFKVLKAAPNGEHKIALDFSDRPHPTTPALDYKSDGFFFSADDYTPRSVEMTKAGIITVSGSNADPLPETTVSETTERAPETTKEPTGSSQSGSAGGYVTEIITEIVTDAEGEAVTDANGEAVVTEVPIAVPEKTPVGTEEETTAAEKEPVTEIVYVTDAEGEQVTEPGGEAVTEIVVIEDDGNINNDTIILVISIVAIAAAVALIVFVVISRKKENKEEE